MTDPAASPEPGASAAVESASSPVASTRLTERIEPILSALHRQQVIESLAHRSQEAGTPLTEQLIHRQQEEEIRRSLRKLAAADCAHMLEMLPVPQRLLVWELLDDERAAMTLIELGEGALAGLIAACSRGRLKSVVQHMEADDLSLVAPFLPEDLLAEVVAGLADRDQAWLNHSLAYGEDSVGALMVRDSLLLSDRSSVGRGIEYIRGRDVLPDHTDKLFIVHGQRRVVGVVPLTRLLRHDPETRIRDIMDTDVVRFHPEDDAEEAAYTFERYDLICAPVVDEHGRLLGRLTVDRVMDYLRELNEEQALAKEGLDVRSDLFGPVWSGAKARWLWLGINLMTAFIATRFIALFDGAIESLVALAALLPIVASLGGNTGQQTAALMIRSLTLDQIHRDNLRVALRKELAIAGINGTLWGSIMGVIAGGLYGSLMLGLVMAAAVMLNLMIAALTGILAPLCVDRLGRDPAMGSTVLLTFITDSMGFFIFLGLASLVLVP